MGGVFSSFGRMFKSTSPASQALSTFRSDVSEYLGGNTNKTTGGNTNKTTGDNTSGIMGANIWIYLAGSLLNGFQTGQNIYYQNEYVKSQANLAAYQAYGAAQIAGYNADIVGANKVLSNAEYNYNSTLSQAEYEANKALVELSNQQALEKLGRQQSALTGEYKTTQGSNIAASAAGNVDVSSGSTGKVLEGNAVRYGGEMAALRRVYDLQQWQGESSLAILAAQNTANQSLLSAKNTAANSILDAQIASLGYQQSAYNTTASAYRTIANLQGSSWYKAINGGLFKATDSFFGTSLGSWAYGKN